MHWDMSDRARTTRRPSRVWLHLSASPMIVHPTFSVLGLLGTGETDLIRAGAAVRVIWFWRLSRWCDRRALLVSPVLRVVRDQRAAADGQRGERQFRVDALGVGSALLLLSVFWHRHDGAVLGVMPPRRPGDGPAT